ncbi:cytochrome c-type biogenesis protein CcmH/NrfF [Thermomonas haemolytica]|uniref:Cytochrome c-type biogenesis protein n=1 Tax=Thermomonas haemolytica TaxID=141949 RepID=A0A4R3N7G8_9GAMM|nr:cytochrome c-type biogenesis protein CcmH/NrfF [Thermomonas haemolytica]
MSTRHRFSMRSPGTRLHPWHFGLPAFARRLCPSFPRRRESLLSGARDANTKSDSRLRGNDVKSILLFVCLLLTPIELPAFAQANQQADAAPLQFRDAAEEARFHALTVQLRCVMCQNQSLADSNALIALQLRREVLDLMRQGKSDAAIKDYLVQRYGEFVLYTPRLEPATLLLWAGPVLVLLAGAAVVVARVRRRKDAAPAPTADDGQEW